MNMPLPPLQPSQELLSPEALAAALRQIGAERYHNLHPFHRRLHNGELTLDQVRAWALNRYNVAPALREEGTLLLQP